MAREIEEEFNDIGIEEIAGLVHRPEFRKDRVVHEGPVDVEDHAYLQYRHFDILSLDEEFALSKKLADFIRAQAGGENAEAYWAWGGDQLIMQARPADGCS